MIPRAASTVEPGFTAPELLEQEVPGLTEASDIYVFAMTIMKLGTGSNPFKGYKWQAINHGVQQGARPSRPSTLGGLSDAGSDTLWSLLEKMWAHDPTERPIVPSVAESLAQNIAASMPMPAFVVSHPTE